MHIVSRRIGYRKLFLTALVCLVPGSAFGQNGNAANPWTSGLAPATTYPSYGAPGYGTPGGYEGRVGSPYYYSPTEYDPYASPYANSGNGWQGQGSAPASYYGANYGNGYGTGYGSPVSVSPGLPADPYYHHFGPGYYRQAEYGHYRFPYYTYRAPWYFPGHPSYNRDTNLPW